jgi:hypothetical protein
MLRSVEWQLLTFGATYRPHIQAPRFDGLNFENGMIGYRETSISTSQRFVTSQKSGNLIYTAVEA